jgi:hypothetical protein
MFRKIGFEYQIAVFISEKSCHIPVIAKKVQKQNTLAYTRNRHCHPCARDRTRTLNQGTLAERDGSVQLTSL